MQKINELRALADKATEGRLRSLLAKDLSLPPEAVEWLLTLSGAWQSADDVLDDPPSRDRLYSLLWAAFVDMNVSPFFREHCNVLVPAMGTQILKWIAANEAEDAGESDAKSYMWRAGYYDIVLLVFLLCHGSEEAMKHARTVLSLYGETFEDYMKEMRHG